VAYHTVDILEVEGEPLHRVEGLLLALWSQMRTAQRQRTTLVHEDARVELRGVILDVQTLVAGLDEVPYTRGGVQFRIAQTEGAEAGGCGALVVGEGFTLRRQLRV
jgi:hypothetical protein